MDTICDIIIAEYIFPLTYVSVKQSSLILADSWQNSKSTDLVRQTNEEDGFKKKNRLKVRSIFLRPAGLMVVFAAVHIEVDCNKRLADVGRLIREVTIAIRSNMLYIKKYTTFINLITNAHTIRLYIKNSSSMQTKHRTNDRQMLYL